MNTLIFTPDRNTPGRADYSGAFLPEALRFNDKHGGRIVQVDQSLEPWARAAATIKAIRETAPNIIAVMGHGTRRGLPSVGWSLWNLDRVSSAIAEGAESPVVLCYCCSAAGGQGPGGDGGYCDLLRDQLTEDGAKGCVVYGHDRGGHSTANPFVRQFWGPAPAIGGKWVIEPGSTHWDAWSCCGRTRKRADGSRVGFGTPSCPERGCHGTLRFRFPFISKDKLLGELS